MRKIEELMVQATREGKTWQRDNTTVHVAYRAPDGTANYVVELHGNPIAFGYVGHAPHLVSMQGWDTQTTRSRLRALLPGRVVRGDGQTRVRDSRAGGLVLIGGRGWTQVAEDPGAPSKRRYTVRVRYAMEHVLEVEAADAVEAADLAREAFGSEDLSEDEFVEVEDCQTLVD